MSSRWRRIVLMEIPITRAASCRSRELINMQPDQLQQACLLGESSGRHPPLAVSHLPAFLVDVLCRLLSPFSSKACHPSRKGTHFVICNFALRPPELHPTGRVETADQHEKWNANCGCDDSEGPEMTLGRHVCHAKDTGHES